jgi:hypothetical protein
VRTLLVGTDYPTLTPPGSLTASPLDRRDPDGPVEQHWSAGQDTPIALQTSVPAAVRSDGAYGRIVRQLDVHGSPAVLYRDGAGEYGQQQVQWTPNRRQTITLRLTNDRRHRWSADEAVALARSVSNYTTEATGRLPQPATPGTTVASYSSADGPVRHAPNMWKSSGVYVGVSCAGTGTVTVALRGITYPFRCAAALTDHVVKSIGQPNDPFFLDVTASKGVRWAVTLARASLDGS